MLTHFSRRWQAINLLGWSCGAIGMAALPALALPFQTQIIPATLRLGDTAALQIQVESPQPPPLVKIGNKTYPVFPLGGNRYRALIPSTPLEKPGVRNSQVTADGKTQTIPLNFIDRKFRIQRINLPPGKSGVEATPYELKKVAAFKALVTPTKYWDGKFANPSKAETSTPFGVKRYYNGVFADDYYHRGLDYAGAKGSPVTAPAAGRIVMVGLVKNGFRVHGNAIGLDHGQGVVSIFMHLSRVGVKEGDMVKTGDLLGAIGTTGASTGPHLHWGLYVNGIGVEPAQWLSQSFD
jgi:murein DD-endopeptidase MepM/ murein hydrolase activator NlpD